MGLILQKRLVGGGDLGGHIPNLIKNGRGAGDLSVVVTKHEIYGI